MSAVVLMYGQDMVSTPGAMEIDMKVNGKKTNRMVRALSFGLLVFDIRATSKTT